MSAAASLREAMGDIGRDYEKRRGVRVRFNFGGSGALQAQIARGAPVDVFISAAPRNMDVLQGQNLLLPGTRRDIAANSLVLVVPLGSTLNLRRFLDVASPRVSRVALGGPSVPAGERAQEVFEKLGVWPQVLAKAVRGRDVREALFQVESGNVDAGVVYATDAASTRRVRVVATAPASFHRPIRYPAAVMRATKSPAQARDFVRFLASASSRATLRRLRFRLP